MIHTSWGGTPAEAWTRRGVLKSDTDFRPILERYDEAVRKYPQTKKEHEQKIEQWKQAVERAKAEGKKPPRRPRDPFGPGHPHSPSGLYNAMIAPVIPYGIQGAIWYQGESNAGRAYQYRKLFPAMIKNWRKDWEQGDFPFLFVQLANFRAVEPDPNESDWAELREAQLMTLAIPNAGMATIIDIGEANDIHPKNKQDVGKRLALWALAKTYGKEMVYSGPLYKSMEIKGHQIVLGFDHVGGGLVAGGGERLKGFAVAGADRKFIWADARIEGDRVVVGSDQVSEPVAVRYAWADNPVCNLYNREGLPASPFRTDQWPGVTVDAR
jgi:sialate O-acetylesterase